MDAASFPVLFFFGAAVGAAGSALGIGGGIFIVPFLVLALGLPMHQAVAASLAGIVAVSCTVGAVNIRRRLANVRLAGLLAATTALGSVAGALAAGLLSPGALKLLFALVLLPVSLLMYFRRGAGAPAVPAGKKAAFSGEFYDPALKASVTYQVRRVKRASGASFFAGALGGLLGIGGGIVQVPLMNLVCGVPIKAAAATSNLLVGVSAAASLLVYLRRGQVPGALAAALAAGAAAGALLGVYALYRVRSEKLQAAFAVLAFGVAVKMLLEAV